jgi:phosphoribosyl-dephospho-CoA transferase
VELERTDALIGEVPVPDWVPGCLARAPLVVVRRARLRGGWLPVGVRGPSRRERFAAWLSPEMVASRIRPEDLTGSEKGTSLSEEKGDTTDIDCLRGEGASRTRT